MNPWKAREEKLRTLARKQELLVLVWGPGDPGSKASANAQLGFRKRKQIKAEIEQIFPGANVRFSEDSDLQNMTDYMRRQLRREMVHARIADVIVVLDVSRGADLEVDHFIQKYAWFREKAYVLLPQKYVGTKGLVADVFDLLPRRQLIGFTEDELKTCHVATQVCISIVDEIAMQMLADI